MFNKISSTDPMFAAQMLPTQKLKLGSEVTYTPLYWLGAGARLDVVQPNMNDSRESFTVITPRLPLPHPVHQQRAGDLQYTHYFLGSRTKLSVPVRPGQR
jgi:hypothetical protein